MKKLICLLLALITCFTSLFVVGCKDKKAEEVKDDSKIMFADFEEWGPNFQTMALYGYFGRITRNTDTKFVKGGNYSAKLQPVGGRVSITSPCFVMPLKSDLFDYDYSDFTYYEEVSAYLYNDSEKAITMTFGLAASHNNSTATLMAGEKVVLAPKTWTRASYLVDCTFLSIAGDPTAISGVYFQFPDTGVEYPDQAPSIYLDNVVLTKAAEQATIDGGLELDKTDTTTEICDFEKIWQKYAYRAEVREEIGEVKIVKAADYDITASSGENVLRVMRTNTIQTNFNVTIPAQLMKAAGLDKVPEEDWASTYFCFDMYNDSDKFAQYHAIWAYTESGTHIIPNKWKGPNAEGEYYWEPDNGYYTWPRPEYGKWTSYKISLWELSQGLNAKEYVTKTGGFAMTFATLPAAAGEEWVVFLDNFRLEKGEKLKGVN